MRTLVLLASGLLTSGAAVAPVILPDIPKEGDEMTIVYKDDDAMVAVDSEGVRENEDGSKSVLVIMVTRHETAMTAKSSRVAYKCHAEQYKIEHVDVLGPNGEVVRRDDNVGNFEQIRPGSLAEIIGRFVCNGGLTKEVT
jgi:hypothetical protein